jgi:hypothetical protein
MPPVSERDLDDDATVWPFLREGRDGSDVVAPPEHLPCKLTWKKSSTRDADGNTVMIEGRMATADRVAVNSVVWPGKPEDLPAGTGFSDEDEGLYQVLGEERGSGPSRWDADGYVYTLVRYGRSLPQEATR